mmetsp:Transcript_118928/g.333086  ORF Transcript_118928/g.333086 Transcript_118928/m.333086 type:complete len:743 (-) Transcript_118928:92-2320(-)
MSAWQRNTSREVEVNNIRSSLRVPYQALHETSHPDSTRHGPPSKMDTSCGLGPSIHRCWRRIIVDPSSGSTSRWVDLWDSQLVILLVITAVLTPYEMAYTSPSMDWMFAFDRVCDVSFCLNTLLMFFLAYPDPKRPSRFVKEPGMVAWHYLTGWFLLDALALTPVEVYYAALRPLILRFAGREDLEFIRLLRVLRLLRLARFTVLFERWTTSFGWSFAKLTLLKFFVGTILCCHWMACIWGGMAFHLQRVGEQNWLDALRVAKGGSDSLYEDAGSVYCMSLYWAIVTLTSIGYGDITPQCSYEYWFACFGMSLMAAMWAYVIGSVCSIVGNLQPHDLQFHRTMDDLNFLLKDRQMPSEMCTKFRKYFQEARERSKQEVEKSVIKQMSPMLQGECAMYLHCSALKTIWYLRDLRKEVIIWAARHLSLELYAPEEDILAERTCFIIRRGVCCHNGRLLTSGAIWGEDMLLSNDFLRQHVQAKALSYLSVLRLHIDNLFDVVVSFSDAKESLRVAQVRIAMVRGMIRLSQTLRYLKEAFDFDFWQLDEGNRSRLYSDILAGRWHPHSIIEKGVFLKHYVDQGASCVRSRARIGTQPSSVLQASGNVGRHGSVVDQLSTPAFHRGTTMSLNHMEPTDSMSDVLSAIAELTENMARVEAKLDALNAPPAHPLHRGSRASRSRIGVGETWGSDEPLRQTSAWQNEASRVSPSPPRSPGLSPSLPPEQENAHLQLVSRNWFRKTPKQKW